MNHNRKRREAERKRRDADERERRRREEASKVGLAVDYSALVPFSSYGPPDFHERGYYLDHPFTCEVCGREEVWSASQQKWWYEVARGSVFSVARRCRVCRHEARAYKGKADPPLSLQQLDPDVA